MKHNPPLFWLWFIAGLLLWSPGEKLTTSEELSESSVLIKANLWGKKHLSLNYEKYLNKSTEPLAKGPLK